MPTIFFAAPRPARRGSWCFCFPCWSECCTSILFPIPAFQA